MKARICHPPFIPPLTDIRDLLGVRAEISIKFVPEF
jgi:hypothetical protein